jgi:putative oxidoreductase
MKVLFLIGRILFGGFFLTSGLNHFTHHTAMSRMVGGAGIPLPQLAVIGSGLLIFLGGASILLGVLPRSGSCLIIIFLLIVTPIAHAFWAASSPQAFADDLNNFTKNAALLGGAIMILMIPQPWPWSVGRIVPKQGKEELRGSSSTRPLGPSPPC